MAITTGFELVNLGSIPSGGTNFIRLIRCDYVVMVAT